MAMETALMEFFLLVISLLLMSIGWVIRKYARLILGRIDGTIQRLDNHEERLEETSDEVEKVKNAMCGNDDTPWDGYIVELKKSKSEISTNRTAIQRHRRVLKREGMIDPRNDMQTQNLDELNHDDWPK
jgi:hypothetical protein